MPRFTSPAWADTQAEADYWADQVDRGRDERDDARREAEEEYR